MTLVKIIHQIWEGKREPIIPTRLRILAKTWSDNNPTWEYHLWQEKEMNNFVRTYFPDFWTVYNSFEYDVQRWDAIRYMILYVYGGIYVDLDTECFKSIDSILNDKNVCFGLEPKEHIITGYPTPLIGNAFMYSLPKQNIWLKILDLIIVNINRYKSITKKGPFVMHTTGPLMITEIVSLHNDGTISLLPSKYVAPISKFDLLKYMANKSDALHQKILNAYCVHYFFGSWESSFSIYKTYNYD